MNSGMDGALERIRLVRDLTSNGVGPDRHARGVRDGTWSRVRRGACVEGLLSDDAVTRHVELIAATIPQLKADAWALSHTSAAVMLGLPVPHEELGAVWITRPGGRSAHRREQLMTRVCEFEADEIITVGGLRVTCPERTAIDIARQHGTGSRPASWSLTPSCGPAAVRRRCRNSWSGARGVAEIGPPQGRLSLRTACRRVLGNR